MMRLMVFALILSLGHASVAIAGETLLQSGTRHARQLAGARSPSAPNAVETKYLKANAAHPPALQAPPTLASSGMRKRMKILIGAAVATAFAGVVYAIDQGVEDSTPSSLGQR